MAFGERLQEVRRRARAVSSTPPAAHHRAVRGRASSTGQLSHRMRNAGSRTGSVPRMESTVMRMIWGVRALNTMARHAHSSAAAKCPQQGRRYFPMRDSFSRRDNFRVVSMKAQTLPSFFYSLFSDTISGRKKSALP